MEFSRELEIIATTLRKSEKVNSHDSEEEKESETLAHSLLDMEESFKVILNELLPRLRTNNLSGEEVDDVLLDLGEEFRHMDIPDQ